MRIVNIITSSFFKLNVGAVYSSIVSGKATEINHRNREPMVLMTKADFDTLIEKAARNDNR